MQYLLTPYSQKIQPFVWWEGAFSEQELDWLQAQARTANTQATVGGNPTEDELKKIRRSQVKWLDNTSNTRWVYEKLAHVVSRLNADYFQFNLTGFGEALQLTNYECADRGTYEWHQDYGGGISRKLSLVLQLSDPADYEGGNLQIMTCGQPENIRKQRGLISVFPSYTLHQVTPVTQGSRQSLVTWVSGPSFL